jgi:hypothetical protein
MKKNALLDLIEVFEGSDWGFGVADVGVSLRESEIDILGDPFRLRGQFLPLAPQIHCEGLILWANHHHQAPLIVHFGF